MLTDRGVTHCTRGDLTGDDLPRIEADPQAERRSVSALDLRRQLHSLLLDSQCGETRPYRVILQRDRRAEHRHDPVAGELVDRAAEVLHHRGRAANHLSHDFAQPLGTDRRRDVHRVHHVGEQHGHLLVLGMCFGLGHG
jgi:hypothetical protein